MAGPGNPVLGPVLQKNISGFDLGFLKISPALDPVLTNLHLNWWITTGQSPVLVIQSLNLDIMVPGLKNQSWF